MQTIHNKLNEIENDNYSENQENIRNYDIETNENGENSENTIHYKEENANMDIKKNEKEIKKKFDYSKKNELRKKIEKIKKKEYLVDIFKIITAEKKEYSVNNNGIFIFFHELSDEIYEKLEKYVNNIYTIYKTNKNINNIFTSEISETINDIEKYNEKQLSNKEKTISKRKKYEEYLSKNQE